MGDAEVKLRIDLGLEDDADAAELADATVRLRRELLELDLESVEQPVGEPPPPGTRAVGAAVLGSLVVTAAQDLVGVVVRAVSNWIGRRPHRHVRLEIDGDSIEVTDPSAEDQHQMIEAFLARHATAPSES